MKLVTARFEKDVFVGVLSKDEERIIHLGKLEKQLNRENTIPNQLLTAIEMGQEFISDVEELLLHGENQAALEANSLQ